MPATSGDEERNVIDIRIMAATDEAAAIAKRTGGRAYPARNGQGRVYLSGATAADLRAIADAIEGKADAAQARGGGPRQGPAEGPGSGAGPLSQAPGRVGEA